MHEDPIPNVESENNCGLFQLYFYTNMLDASVESEIINHERLTKNVNFVEYTKNQ